MVENKIQVYGSEFLKKFEEDYNCLLEYGIPLPRIPYQKIASIQEDLENPDPLKSVNQAYDLVEQEKDKGKPGAFVVERFDYDQDCWVYDIWSWAD
jgi:hypothetical protein